jgi:glycerophosphoryl diester phosphodiesterase
MHFSGSVSALMAGLAVVGQVAAKPCPKPVKPIKKIDLGPRPYYLVDDLEEGPLKAKLESCKDMEMKSTDWSIGHRGGGTLMIPEHSKESNLAGARMGAGILECDVAFTADRELVCRHSQCDLHYTTNIVAIPELNAKCTTPFKPAADGKPAQAKCCTSDITVTEYKTLCAKMEGQNNNATTPEQYLKGTPAWRTDLYGTCAQLLTHKEHIAMVDALGLKFTPELKTPEVKMPFKGNYTQEMYAQQLIDEYKEAGIDPERVWPQSFLYSDVLYWLKNEPAFGAQAVYLDPAETPEQIPAAIEFLDTVKADGVPIIAPPIPLLLDSVNGTIVPSAYAKRAVELGLDIISWSLERSPPVKQAVAEGNFYYFSILDALKRDGDIFKVVDVMAREVGIIGLFSDWSATATYYANCFGL